MLTNNKLKRIRTMHEFEAAARHEDGRPRIDARIERIDQVFRCRLITRPDSFGAAGERLHRVAATHTNSGVQ